jgi:hypothetical protein
MFGMAASRWRAPVRPLISHRERRARSLQSDGEGARSIVRSKRARRAACQRITLV